MFYGRVICKGCDHEKKVDREMLEGLGINIAGTSRPFMVVSAKMEKIIGQFRCTACDRKMARYDYYDEPGSGSVPEVAAVVREPVFVKPNRQRFLDREVCHSCTGYSPWCPRCGGTGWITFDVGF